MAGWLLALIALLYVGILFLVASYGDRKRLVNHKQWWSVISGLSLAVYCTSWTFFGVVGQASDDLISILPNYLGPILLFTLFWKVLVKLILVCKRENITSIADFIASRHGKSRGLAVLVTFLLVVGVQPYIALQLKAIVMGFDLLTPGTGDIYSNQAVALVVTFLLAIFVIIFGTRRLDTTEHQQGVMAAIAFESVLKLAAFLLVGGWITVEFLMGGDSLSVHLDSAITQSPMNIPSVVTCTLMSMVATICLPRQFHVIVVESTSIRSFHYARWIFMAYLLMVAVFVLPLTLIGQAWLGDTVDSDAYVIALPLFQGHNWLAVIAYMGGVSAAISMVILATISLSTMISNEVFMPLILQRSNKEVQSFYRFRGLLLLVRRITIFGILLMSYALYKLVLNLEDQSLSELGDISFAAVCQLLPAMLGGLYLKESNRKSAFAGMLVGAFLWFYTMMLPLLISSSYWGNSFLQEGIFGLEFLRPGSLFGIDATGSIYGAAITSFLANCLVYGVGCLLFQQDPIEESQALKFVGVAEDGSASLDTEIITVRKLQGLANRFLGEERTGRLMEELRDDHFQLYASREMVEATERQLAGIMGTSSAKVVMKSALSRDRVCLEDVEAIVDEATEVFQFNRELLSGAIEHINVGICVVDRNLQMVAWNRRYLELFTYPEGLLSVGKPIEDIVRFNVEQGLFGKGDPEQLIEERLGYIRRGESHKTERESNTGQVVEMRGYPMPGGGFVMSFTDITEFRQVEQALKDVNESLEQRVEERTEALNLMNRELRKAKGVAERANHLRSRFFAAVSHDLMQPMNAARLFAASLASIVQQEEEKELTRHLSHSLRSAEDLLKDLLDMSRLEAGKLVASIRDFPLSDVLQPLKTEFEWLAVESELQFRLVFSAYWVRSDSVLLRRVLQNFLTNGFRYCDSQQGKVMLSCRKRGNYVAIEIRDNGEGIAEDKQALIFGEFERLQKDGKGLGLGLSIARGISDVLEHPVAIRSKPGKGSVFSIRVPIVTHQVAKSDSAPNLAASPLFGISVLCVDDQPDVLLGMKSLLTRWGCDVACASSVEESYKLIEENGAPDVMLVDYRLDGPVTGLELIESIQAAVNSMIPSLLITADKHPDIREACSRMGVAFMGKPVKPASLKAWLNAQIASRRVSGED